MASEAGPRDSLEMRSFAMLIASVVRNAMEDFHVKHHSDDQMRELNPIIRGAVYTALDAVSAAGARRRGRSGLRRRRTRAPPSGPCRPSSTRRSGSSSAGSWRSRRA
jgi:hypothetical protein